MTRYPLEPLADTMGLSLDAACVQLGISGTSQQRYLAQGITWRVADRLACRAGLHPAEIWPTWFDDAITDAEIECAADDCTEQFLPVLHQRFCSVRCRERQGERTRYQARADVRARKIAARRRYYAENGEYERARQRRYDRARRHEQRQTTDQTTQGAA